MTGKIKYSQGKKRNKPYVVIISGLTASGKTDFSWQLARQIPCEIINADVGQFYTKFSVGTAKPDWQNQKVPHHCFDLLSSPKDLSVFDFRKIVLDKIKIIWGKNKIPIIVGGSLFYVKSLFFPLEDFAAFDELQKSFTQGESNNKLLWNRLNAIDPERARSLHINDTYRIKRALTIWEKTGVKPSYYKPRFDPKFHARLVFIDLPKKIIYEKINKRTEQMIKDLGWIEETEGLINTEWEGFLKNKKLIGYPEIINWIKNGKKVEEMNGLIDDIQTKTRRYAKRQLTFWEGFCSFLKEQSKKKPDFLIRISVLKDAGENSQYVTKNNIKKDLKYLSTAKTQEIFNLIDQN